MNGEPAAEAAATPAAENTCCGERHPAVAGTHLKLYCQLCPNSPTYWRNPDRLDPLTGRRESTP